MIHVVQHHAKQEMNGQLAEHDGYFATDVFATAVARVLQEGSAADEDGVGDAALMFPGLVPLILRMSRNTAEFKLLHDPKTKELEFDIETYQAWRDSFGAGVHGSRLEDMARD